MPVYTNKTLGPSNLSARVRVHVRMGQVSSWNLRNEEGVPIVLLLEGSSIKGGGGGGCTAPANINVKAVIRRSVVTLKKILD